MAGHRRETLSTHIPLDLVRPLGFRSQEASGYIMPNGRLYAHYNMEIVRQVEGREEPDIRRVLVVTDGSQWYVGARLGRASTSAMLNDMVDHGITNGSAERYAIQGRDLLKVLGEPDKLPEIEQHKEQGRPYLTEVKGHSFE